MSGVDWVRVTWGSHTEAGKTRSANEINELYRRGVNQFAVQVWTCSSADCSDAPVWKGTDGTASSYFTEMSLVAPDFQRDEAVP